MRRSGWRIEVAFSVALTGGIASGKTTVANLLAEHGALLIDSDQLAREVVEPGTPGLAQVVTRFGEQVLTQAGSLDRQALGDIVFADAAARADLNAIVHPLVRRRRAELIAQAAADQIVVSVIPLLVETGLVDQFDAVVVVDVPSQTQVARLVRRNDISPEQAQARLDAQASRAERLAAADWVVTNSGSRAELEAQVERLWSQMRSKAQGCEPGK
jgi:dephospho-CoA kinase